MTTGASAAIAAPRFYRGTGFRAAQWVVSAERSAREYFQSSNAGRDRSEERMAYCGAGALGLYLRGGLDARCLGWIKEPADDRVFYRAGWGKAGL